MVDEKELDMIEQATLLVSTIQKEKAELKELIKRNEAIETRRIMGGMTAAGEPQPAVLSEEEKIKLAGKQYFKGGMLEGVFK